MPQSEIRVTAVDRVARVLHELASQMRDFENSFQTPQARWMHGEPEPLPPFDETAETWREVAASIVDALGDLLPTEIRYGVRHPVHQTEARFVGEPLDDCRRYADEFETTVIRQYLGEWVPNA
ncbi:hypothetical protein ACWFRB_09340 [Rhodococcus sp. NPDC055112]